MVEINSQNLFLCSVGVILFGIKNHTIKPTALIIDMDVFLPYYRTYGSLFLSYCRIYGSLLVGSPAHDSYPGQPAIVG